MKVKAAIRFYNKDVWVTYKEEGDMFQHHFRIPYENLYVYFIPEAPDDMSEKVALTPLQFLRVGYLHSQIAGLESDSED